MNTIRTRITLYVSVYNLRNVRITRQSSAIRKINNSNYVLRYCTHLFVLNLPEKIVTSLFIDLNVTFRRRMDSVALPVGL